MGISREVLSMLKDSFLPVSQIYQPILVPKKFLSCSSKNLAVVVGQISLFDEDSRYS